MTEITDEMIENALEDAAKAAFTKAQSVYRSDHDHFPLKHTWETTFEGVREGWRAIAYAAVEAAVMPPLGTQPEPRHLRSDALSAHPSPVGAVKALDAALNSMRQCVHDGGLDREIGPIGCNLGDNCVCIGVYPKVNEARHSLVSSVKEEPDYVLCPCTTFEQDEDCPIGYPSMLCSACDGKGHAPMDKVVALAAEMMKIAEQVDELEDPFAAWESVSLLQSQNDQFRSALESSAPVKGETEDGDHDKPSDWMETPNAGTLRGVDPYAEWKKIQRTAEMQSAIMADPERTGGWPGSQRVSDAFADLAERIEAVVTAAMGNAPQLQKTEGQTDE